MHWTLDTAPARITHHRSWAEEPVCRIAVWPAMSPDLTSAECRELAALARSAAVSTNLVSLRQKHTDAAEAWDKLADHQQFMEKKRAERETMATSS